MTNRQKVIDAARSMASEAMRANGEVEPMIIAHIGDTLKAFELADVSALSPVGRDIAALLIGSAMRAAGADAYVHITEAWYAPTSPNDPLAGVRPSQRPDRIEALVVSASDREGDTLATYRLVRNANGKFQRFDLLDNTDLEPGMTAEGRFLGLLRPPVVE